jgi:hypothetical protein
MTTKQGAAMDLLSPPPFQEQAIKSIPGIWNGNTVTPSNPLQRIPRPYKLSSSYMDQHR